MSTCDIGIIVSFFPLACIIPLHDVNISDGCTALLIPLQGLVASHSCK